MLDFTRLFLYIRDFMVELFSSCYIGGLSNYSPVIDVCCSIIRFHGCHVNSSVVSFLRKRLFS